MTPPAARADANRPSILLITIDTLRPDRLGFHGAARPTSPFLDSLAAESTVFDNAYSTSSWTVPSTVSMMTGVYPTSHGVVHGAVTRGVLTLQEQIPASLTVLPEELRKLGYRTYGVTANHHLADDLGFGRGFDRYVCLGFATADKVNASVLEWKREIVSGKGPFFLWIHYFDPHRVYFARAPWVHDFLPGTSGEEIDQIVRMQDQWPRMTKHLRSRPHVIDIAFGLYDSEIRYLDEHIRSLYAALPLDSAWTMITADHGEEFLEHGDLGHSHNLYNQTMRIPMLIRPPGGGEGRRIPEPVSLVDCPPTILAVAGGTVPRSWQGIDLEGADDARKNRSFIAAELDRLPEHSGLRAIVSGRWKLITRLGTSWSELYDLGEDPGEKTNRSADDRPRSQQLQQNLLRYLRSLPMPPSAVQVRPTDKDTEEKLRRLGYIH